MIHFTLPVTRPVHLLTFVLSSSLLFWGGWTSLGSELARAETRTPLIEMVSGPSPKITCQFELVHSAAPQGDDRAIQDVVSTCSGEDLSNFGLEQPQRFTLEEIRRGVVFMKERTFDMTVITVSAPNLDAHQGGIIEIQYLKNAIFGSFGTFRVDLERIGKSWVPYTDPNLDHRPFTRMKVTTYLLGVRKVEAQ